MGWVPRSDWPGVAREVENENGARSFRRNEDLSLDLLFFLRAPSRPSTSETQRTAHTSALSLMTPHAHTQHFPISFLINPSAP